MKILIVKPSSLGDVVHALPVLRCLRRHLPESEIYWWITPELAPLLQDDPDLNGTVPFDRSRWSLPVHWPDAIRTIRAQRQQRFDWVIDLQSLARTGFLAWFVNGQLTIGLDDPREGARGLYDLIIRRPTPQTHAVDWYLAALAPLGIPVRWDYDWIPPRPAAAAALRKRWSADGRWIAVLPGARWNNKRWPVRHFAEWVRQSAALGSDVHIALLGASADRELGAAISAANPARCLDLTGQTTLPEMVEWLRVSELVVSNDTGPMHIAAALGKPVLGLFGPTDPRRTGPYGSSHRILRRNLACVPCMKDTCAHVPPYECLESISPGEVAGGVEARLTRGSW